MKLKGLIACVLLAATFSVAVAPAEAKTMMMSKKMMMKHHMMKDHMMHKSMMKKKMM